MREITIKLNEVEEVVISDLATRSGLTIEDFVKNSVLVFVIEMDVQRLQKKQPLADVFFKEGANI